MINTIPIYKYSTFSLGMHKIMKIYRNMYKIARDSKLSYKKAM